MRRLILLAVFAFAAAVWAQESADEETPVEESQAESEETLTAEELEELDIGIQEDHTDDDDDVFKPTDAVSYQQSVEFPVDI